MSPNKSMLQSLKSALYFSLYISGSCLAVIAFRFVLDGFLDGHWNTDWKVNFELSAFFGVACFIFTFPYLYLTSKSFSQAEEILDHEPAYSNSHNAPLTGFVAMEYYALIWNRTYVVFIAPEGLYGWKATGAVTSARPNYFQHYVDLLADPEMMQDYDAIKKLSKLKNGFFIPRSTIVSVEIIDKQKWGMGLIPHCGRIRIDMTTEKSREFILLGSVYPTSIRNNILEVATSS
jgi:hypothetical protein